MTDDKLRERLLPCPFCGGVMRFQSRGNVFAHVEQGECPIGAMGFTSDKITAWNARKSALLDQLAEALERAGEKFGQWSRAFASHGGMGQLSEEMAKDADTFRQALATYRESVNAAE